MMDWNDAMENEYLDRLMADVGDSNNKNDMDTTSPNIMLELPAKETDGNISTDDEKSGWQGEIQVAWHRQGTEDKNIDKIN